MSNDAQTGPAPTLPFGFLQICIDKRFHRAVQERFEAETGLPPHQYWLHADVGGTPGLAKDRPQAADYCFNQRGLIHMGWAAHGSGCGGFQGKDDAFIYARLTEQVQRHIANYVVTPHGVRVIHHMFFITDECLRYMRVPPVPLRLPPCP